MCWKYCCHLCKKQGDPIDVQDKYYNPIDVQDKYYKMEIVESITFEFFMISLDTLSLNDFLPYIPSSNESTCYMVGNIILRPFQRYMEFPPTP
jgi:hypothetical protein